MEMSGQIHGLAAFLQRKRPWYPLYRRLGKPHSWSGHGAEKNF